MVAAESLTQCYTLVTLSFHLLQCHIEYRILVHSLRSDQPGASDNCLMAAHLQHRCCMIGRVPCRTQLPSWNPHSTLRSLTCRSRLRQHTHRRVAFIRLKCQHVDRHCQQIFGTPDSPPAASGGRRHVSRSLRKRWTPSSGSRAAYSRLRASNDLFSTLFQAGTEQLMTQVQTSIEQVQQTADKLSKGFRPRPAGYPPGQICRLCMCPESVCCMFCTKFSEMNAA